MGPMSHSMHFFDSSLWCSVPSGDFYRKLRCLRFTQTLIKRCCQALERKYVANCLLPSSVSLRSFALTSPSNKTYFTAKTTKCLRPNPDINYKRYEIQHKFRVWATGERHVRMSQSYYFPCRCPLIPTCNGHSECLKINPKTAVKPRVPWDTSRILARTLPSTTLPTVSRYVARITGKRDFVLRELESRRQIPRACRQ